MIDDFTPPRAKKPAAADAPPRSAIAPSTGPVEPPFEPPSRVEPDEPDLSISMPQETSPPGMRGGPASIFGRLRVPRKKMILLLIPLVLIIGGGVWWFTRPAPAKPQQAVKKEEPKAPEPTTVPSRLTGVQVEKELDKLPVTGIMIENSPDARPQAGLKDAGVVFEAIAEGGITRFLALYHTEQPDYVGPVRSLRPYYLDFLAAFDAGIVHAGGSGKALAEVAGGGFRDIDYGANPSFFQRVNNRYAPHNLYTNRGLLLQLHNSRGWGTSQFNGFTRKEDKPLATPTQKSIDFAVSSFLYNPHYDYHPPTNSYNRGQANQAHVDERTGVQISPKVVIALVMPHSLDGIYSVYQTTGKGKAYIFQDGGLSEGFWEKPDRRTQLTFSDGNGAPLAINAGPVWFTLVSSFTDVSAKP